MNLYGGINSQDDSEKENHWKTCFIIYKRCFKVIVIYLFWGGKIIKMVIDFILSDGDFKMCELKSRITRI